MLPHERTPEQRENERREMEDAQAKGEVAIYGLFVFFLVVYGAALSRTIESFFFDPSRGQPADAEEGLMIKALLIVSFAIAGLMGRLIWKWDEPLLGCPPTVSRWIVAMCGILATIGGCANGIL